MKYWLMRRECHFVRFSRSLSRCKGYCVCFSSLTQSIIRERQSKVHSIRVDHFFSLTVLMTGLKGRFRSSTRVRKSDIYRRMRNCVYAWNRRETGKTSFLNFFIWRNARFVVDFSGKRRRLRLLFHGEYWWGQTTTSKSDVSPARCLYQSKKNKSLPSRFPNQFCLF